MQEAAELYARKKYGDKCVDEDFIRELAKKYKKKRMVRMMRPVAIIAIVMVSGIASVIWYNGEGAYGGKQIVDRCIGFISPLNVENEVDEEGYLTQTITVTEENEFEELTSFIEEFFVPGYIPSGYSFDELIAVKDEFSTDMDFAYASDDDTEIYVGLIYDEKDDSISIRGEEYISPETGETLYIDENKQDDEVFITEVCDEYTCIVTMNGNANRENAIKIIENIEKY